ncbi:hypothetical protein NX059_007737 [Plenodomus lindquistii]|nr:hypothetical protein NX059_007737 [Plenodomus lindquistii]
MESECGEHSILLAVSDSLLRLLGPNIVWRRDLKFPPWTHPLHDPVPIIKDKKKHLYNMSAYTKCDKHTQMTDTLAKGRFPSRSKWAVQPQELADAVRAAEYQTCARLSSDFYQAVCFLRI